MFLFLSWIGHRQCIIVDGTSFHAVLPGLLQILRLENRTCVLSILVQRYTPS